MQKKQLTPAEISELNRYNVWLTRLSNSLNFMAEIVAGVPKSAEQAENYSVQERNKMLRLALEDLKMEKDKINKAIEELQNEYEDCCKERGAPDVIHPQK
jgi:hypothetical protein